MKKLLVLLLVLGLVSSASAAYSLRVAAGTSTPAQGDYVGSEISIMENTDAWIGIYNDGQDSGTGQAVLYVSIETTSNGAFVNPLNGHYYTDVMPDLSPNEYYGNTYYGAYDNGQTGGAGEWVEYGLLWQGATTQVLGVGVADAKQYNCLGMGDVIVHLWSTDTVTPLDTFTIHQIPEPMTLALLGLGGLFLRRRK